MEFAPGVIKAQRLLAGALLSAVALLAWVESRSPLAAAIRSGKPWICRIEAGGRRGRCVAALYDTSRRTLEMIDLGSTSWTEAADEAGWPADAPLRRELPAFERALLALEIARMNGDQVRQAVFPQEASDRRTFLAALAAPPAARGAPMTIEVLNASQRRGLASDVTKFLRSRGADVVHFGNVPATRTGTVVYDRTGRFDNARWVRDRLGCPAQLVTQVSAKSLVDVTLIVGDDCRL